MNNWTVVRSRSRHYGYGLYSKINLGYLHDGHNTGWYKYKWMAQSRADELNRSGYPTEVK